MVRAFVAVLLVLALQRSFGTVLVLMVQRSLVASHLVVLVLVVVLQNCALGGVRVVMPVFLQGFRLYRFLLRSLWLLVVFVLALFFHYLFRGQGTLHHHILTIVVLT